MKPFQIIVISIFAVLALAGLLLFATFKGFGGGGKPVGSVTIWGTLPAAAIQPALEDLRRVHQEFSTIVYEERDPSSFDADLSDALAAGAGPDLIITTQERLLSEENKLSVIPFSSIPERTFRDTYLPINEIYLTTTGTYGIPLVVDPLVLYYNRSRLSSAGIAQAPATWEAVVGMAPHLTAKSNAGVVSQSAIALGTYGNIPDARALVSLLLLQSGSSISQIGAVGIRSTLASGGENASGSTAANSALTFYTQFADPAKIVYTWNRSLADARQSFVAGDSALYVGFASERALIKAANPNLDFDMAYVPQPGTSSDKVDYGLAYAFAIPKASKNPSGAFRTASALSSASELPLIAQGLGIAPAIRTLLKPSATDIYAPIVYSEALIARAWLSPAPASIDRIFAAMIDSIISGRATVNDALTTADQSLTAALQ
ncbi:MAG: hypothetical protein JWO84_275 [Parcubacteria group bacterium]|nr:hypothetical protein [Parcubacteria group bacterium]